MIETLASPRIQERVIKALSIRQPFANRIAEGEKTIEYRTWKTPYRGPLLIVSSKRPKIEPVGCAVAIVRLSDIQPSLEYDDLFEWMLADVERIEPFPVKGRLGLYDVTLPDSMLIASTA